MPPLRQSPKVMILVLALMGATCFALLHFVDVTLADQAGVRMELPAKLGDWTGQQLKFCHKEGCRKDYTIDQLPPDAKTCPACGEPLFNMTYEEWDQLPKDTQFIKSNYSRAAGGRIYASIVLQGKDRESIHRPERCLVGQGHKVEKFTTIRIPLEPGQPPLNAAIILTHREMNTPQGVVRGGENYYVFWFVGLNRETGNHWRRMFFLGWDRLVNSVAHKWAYVAVSGNREPGSQSYEDEIREFVPLLHKAIVLTPEELKAQSEKPAGA